MAGPETNLADRSLSVIQAPKSAEPPAPLSFQPLGRTLSCCTQERVGSLARRGAEEGVTWPGLRGASVGVGWSATPLDAGSLESPTLLPAPSPRRTCGAVARGTAH